VIFRTPSERLSAEFSATRKVLSDCSPTNSFARLTTSSRPPGGYTATRDPAGEVAFTSNERRSLGRVTAYLENSATILVYFGAIDFILYIRYNSWVMSLLYPRSVRPQHFPAVAGWVGDFLVLPGWEWGRKTAQARVPVLLRAAGALPGVGAALVPPYLGGSQPSRAPTRGTPTICRNEAGMCMKIKDRPAVAGLAVSLSPNSGTLAAATAFFRGERVVRPG